MAPSPPVIAAPPAPPPVAPPPVVEAPPAPPPVAPPPVAQAAPVAPPPVVETPVAPPPTAPVDPVAAGTPPTDTPFNPPIDTGNQNAQASAGNDPVINAATFAPTDTTDIFNTGAQNQVGQETTPPDNNSPPDTNQGGDGAPAPFLATSASVNQGEPQNIQNDPIRALAKG